MDDRQPSSHEMRARMGFAGSILIGMGVAAAIGVGTHNMGVGIGVGVAITIALMVAFTRGASRGMHPDAGDEPEPGDDMDADGRDDGVPPTT